MIVLMHVAGEFVKQLGDKAKEEILGTEAHIKTYYSHSASLGVKYNFVFLPYRVVNEDMSVDGDILK